MGFEFLTAITLEGNPSFLRPTDREEQRSKWSHQCVHMSFDWVWIIGNFGIKSILSQNWGNVLIPNFHEIRNCLWACFVERMNGQIVDRLNRSVNEKHRGL